MVVPSVRDFDKDVKAVKDLYYGLEVVELPLGKPESSKAVKVDSHDALVRYLESGRSKAELRDRYYGLVAFGDIEEANKDSAKSTASAVLQGVARLITRTGLTVSTIHIGLGKPEIPLDEFPREKGSRLDALKGILTVPALLGDVVELWGAKGLEPTKVLYWKEFSYSEFISAYPTLHTSKLLYISIGALEFYKEKADPSKQRFIWTTILGALNKQSVTSACKSDSLWLIAHRPGDHVSEDLIPIRKYLGEVCGEVARIEGQILKQYSDDPFTNAIYRLLLLKRVNNFLRDFMVGLLKEVPREVNIGRRYLLVTAVPHTIKEVGRRYREVIAGQEGPKGAINILGSADAHVDLLSDRGNILWKSQLNQLGVDVSGLIPVDIDFSDLHLPSIVKALCLQDFAILEALFAPSASAGGSVEWTIRRGGLTESDFSLPSYNPATFNK